MKKTEHEMTNDGLTPEPGDALRWARFLRAVAAGDSTSLGQVIDELRGDERGPDAAILLLSTAAEELVTAWLGSSKKADLLTFLDMTITTQIDAE